MRMRPSIAFIFALIAFFFIFSFLFTPHLLSVIAWGRVMRTPPDRHRTRVSQAATFWADVAFRICAWLLHICVAAHLPESGNEPCIVITNHQSTLDILVIAHLLRRCGRNDLRWVLKQELIRVPIIGLVSREMGSASVSRMGDPRDLNNVKTAAQLARRDRASFILFPEGTRFTGSDGSNGFKHVRIPKMGGFKTLRDELPHVPVLSVTLCWLPPVPTGHGKTMFHATAFFGKTLFATATMVRPEEIDADPNWLTTEWVRKEDSLAWIETFTPSSIKTA